MDFHDPKLWSLASKSVLKVTDSQVVFLVESLSMRSILMMNYTLVAKEALFNNCCAFFGHEDCGVFYWSDCLYSGHKCKSMSHLQLWYFFMNSESALAHSGMSHAIWKRFSFWSWIRILGTDFAETHCMSRSSVEIDCTEQAELPLHSNIFYCY